MPIYGQSKTKALLSAAYHKTALYAWTQAQQSIHETDLSVNSSMIFVGIAVMALSCELGIKSMLATPSRIHELDKLFALLTVDEQDEIIEYVIEDSKKMRENKPRNNIPNSCNNRNEFISLLKSCSRNHIQGRYIYEEKGYINLPFWFLQSLSKCLLIPYGIEIEEI